jgi:sigma-E factor negative regulatory protein RseC
VIEETGVVRAVSQGLAEVECDRRTACGSCAVKSGCGTSLLERFFSRRRGLLTARDALGVQPGERVVVGVGEQELLKAALAAYLMPVLVMILGAAAAQWAGELLLPAWADGLSLLGGLVGLAVGLRFLAIRFGRAGQGAGLQAVVLRRETSPAVEVALAGPRDHGALAASADENTGATQPF